MAAATGTVTLDFPRPKALDRGPNRLAFLTGIITVVGDYATGGIVLGTTLSDYFKDLHRVIVSGHSLAAHFDVDTNTLLLYGDAAAAALGVLAEPNGVTLSSTVFDFIAIGRA